MFKKFIYAILMLLLAINIISCSKGFTDSSVSLAQIKDDLIGQKFNIYPDGYGTFTASSTDDFEEFELIETLTDDNVKEFFIKVTFESYSTDSVLKVSGKFTGTLIVKYRKYDEGWKYQSVKVKEKFERLS